MPAVRIASFRLPAALVLSRCGAALVVGRVTIVAFIGERRL